MLSDRCIGHFRAEPGSQGVVMDSANILVAASDRAIIDKIKKCFDPMNHQIIPAYDVSLGMFLAQKNFPHLVICQDQLKEGDAFEFLSEINSDSELADIPFILVTTADSEKYEDSELKSAGILMTFQADAAEGYIISELVPIINEACATRKKRQEYSPE